MAGRPITPDIPFSIYIHTPWCEKKCPYCDFNSHYLEQIAAGLVADELQDKYLAALKRDLKDSLRRFPHLKGEKPVSIFIGGGTPSLLRPAFYVELLSELSKDFVLDSNTEISIEANPGSSERAKFVGYRKAGINRISIGAQSFSPRLLQALGRVHKAEDGFLAYEAARESGFIRINMDLIYALPRQTKDEALWDLSELLDEKRSYLEHISYYQLSIEPNTKFAIKPPSGLPNPDYISDMEEEAEKLLMEAGFSHYEVSAWARGDKAQAEHNLNYWCFGDYLGIGAGAHSKISMPKEPNHDYRVIRETRFRSPSKYMESISQLNHKRELGKDDLCYEFMLNALRLTDGLPLSLFSQTTGLPLAYVEQGIKKGEELGLLQRDKAKGWLMPTKRGQKMLSDTILLFTPQERIKQ